ncbi:outer membrane protein, multidrug efflux system [Arsukibacterium tuosuense]|uniref:Outer membrane protein, multidrug efflux system n=1 Tax=Arsukibacterium tuosuense TaxID=1323745 RepID=A0A285IW36_9GAMM|nr:efflux transporter outer membrane subunit [Arsukibacterium tuosuense]SNY52249.1 outer membrane protein, multidrug efflux system [Arsukibacterium tuosuense]
MRNSLKLSAIAVLLASLSACAVGPDYQTPAKVADISFTSPYQQADQVQSWWQAFDDKALNQLISRALAENRTLAQARANVDRAYAVFRDANNDFLPKGSLDAGYQASENATLAENDNGVIIRGYSAGASLSWDLDLFGKLRRATEAAAAQAQQADILWHDAQVQLISQVATSYGEYRGAQLRLVVAEQNLQNLQQSRAIVMARMEAGMASELELTQIDVQLHQVQAAVPAYRVALLTADATLSALLAQRPGRLSLGAVPHLPELTKPVAVVAGENYLRYRADVASAERVLAARTAEIGVATADLYPNLSVRGFLGFLSGPGLALNSDSQSWSVAPTLSWQAADLGSVKARIRQAEASSQMALAQFEQQVFNAINEMQLALNSYNLSREQQLSTELQWQASKKAMNIARQRYNAGSGEFLALLDAERELLRSRDQLAQLQQQSFIRLVGIYRSFGGGIQLI